MLTSSRPESATKLDEFVKSYDVWSRGLPTISLFRDGEELSQLVCTKEVISSLQASLEEMIKI